MKLTKKIIALLLVAAFAFCFVACGEPTECTSHVDENGDGICDNEGCGATVEKPETVYVPVPVDPVQAAAYVGAIWGAVENAKTVTVSIDMNSTVGKGESIDADGNAVSEAAEDKMSVHFDVTVAAAENAVNLKVVGSADADGEKTAMEAYIVDGVVYAREQYDGEWSDWDVETIEIPEEVSTTVTQIMSIISSYIPEDFEITDDMIAQAKAAIASAVSSLMKVNEDGSFGAKLDVQPAVKAAVDFIAAINPDDTVAEFINSVLALVEPTLTVETILDGVGVYGSVTVGQIYEAVSTAIETETGMTIQDIKDTVLAQQQIIDLLIGYGVVTQEQIDSAKAINVDEAIADYAAMTLDDVAYMIISSASGEAAPATDAAVEGSGTAETAPDTTGTLAETAAQIKAMLTGTTVGEMAGEGFDTFLEVMKSVKVNALYAYVNVKLGADLSFGKIEFGEKVDMALTIPTREYVEVGTDYELVDCTAEQYNVTEIVVAITSISSSETAIVAPEVVEAA